MNQIDDAPLNLGSQLKVLERLKFSIVPIQHVLGSSLFHCESCQMLFDSQNHSLLFLYLVKVLNHKIEESSTQNVLKLARRLRPV